MDVGYCVADINFQ